MSNQAASVCLKCDYDRGGIPHSAPCPECGAPPPDAAVIDGRVAAATCVVCAYDLAGLPETANCPECGTAVERSLKGNQLIHAGPPYLATLHRGVVLVLTGWIIYVINIVFGIFGGAALTGAGGTSRLLFAVLTLLGIASSVLILVGWWKLSTKDPGLVAIDTGDKPRRVVRAVVLINAVIIAVSTIVQLVQGIGTISADIDLLAGVLQIVAFFATIVGYIAQLLYTRWLAVRIPNTFVYKRAKRLLWLGPLLMTFGILLIGLGPLIALVMYWNMLDKVRKDLKAIRAEQATMA